MYSKNEEDQRVKSSFWVLFWSNSLSSKFYGEILDKIYKMCQNFCTGDVILPCKQKVSMIELCFLQRVQTCLQTQLTSGSETLTPASPSVAILYRKCCADPRSLYSSWKESLGGLEGYLKLWVSSKCESGGVYCCFKVSLYTEEWHVVPQASDATHSRCKLHRTT